MATVQELQREVNRFANDVNIGFQPIACNGIAGTATLEAALMALTTVNLADGVSGSEALAAGVLIRSLESLERASDLELYVFPVMANLKAGADDLGLTYITCAGEAQAQPQAQPPKLVPTTPQAQAVLQQKRATVKALSLLGLGLPNWAVYTGGAAFVLSILLLMRKRKR